MKRSRFTPTAVKIVVPIAPVNGAKQLTPKTKLMDLGWAIRNKLVRIETDAVLGTLPANGAASGHSPIRRANDDTIYKLKKMPKPDAVQPQVYAILATLKRLGGSSGRERLLKALKGRLRTDQDVGVVLSLKRKSMVDNGYLSLKGRAA